MKKTSSIFILSFILIISMSIIGFTEGESGDLLSAGHGSTYVIKDDGSLWGWGNMYNGSGNGYRKPQVTPVKILDNAKSVSANSFSGVAVKNDDTLWGWGCFDGYPTGEKQDPKFLTPVKIMEDVKIAANGKDYIMVVKNDHSLWLCGAMYIGDGTNTQADGSEGFVKILDDVKSVHAGKDTVFVIKQDNSLWGWGDNSHAQLGNGTDKGDTNTNAELSMTKILDNVSFVTSSDRNVLAVRLDNSLYGWGKSGIYTENGWMKSADLPQKIMDHVKTCAIDGDNAFIVKTDNTLWGWGYSYTGASVNKKVPYKYEDNVVNVSIGERHAAVIKTDNTLWTMGGNYRYGLGYNSDETWYTPLTKILDNIQDAQINLETKEVEDDGKDEVSTEKIKPESPTMDHPKTDYTDFKEIKKRISEIVPAKDELTVKIKGKTKTEEYEKDLDYTVYFKGKNVRIETNWGINGRSTSIYNEKENATYTYLTDVPMYAEYLEGNYLPIRRLDLAYLDGLEIDTDNEYFHAEIKDNEFFIETSSKNGVKAKLWYSLMYCIPNTLHEEWMDEDGKVTETIDWWTEEIDDHTPIDDSLFHIPESAGELN
ncbi:RCC1 domain-containing protein [Crassaminicella profunda]|uniref:RCC1 domain-containing protein n=1 Tax=Crassaminicella profunda TaxID=1286698 RepID=UPI001CA67A26|nr:hypothetical protein [Crassaminicella profunda]QZY53714.1 hypothetical protein K7H06_11645 [Crassaminicella profunda]